MLDDEGKERVALGHKMEKLLSTEEWKSFVEYMETMLNSHGNLALEPCKGMDDTLDREYQKGAFKGISLTLLQPSAIVAEKNQILSDEEAEREEE